MFPIPGKTELERFYRQDGYSVRALAALYGVSTGPIRRWLKLYAIPRWTKSETNRRTWANTEYRTKKAASIRKAKADPSHRALISQLLTKVGSDPAVREKRRQAHLGTHLSPETKAKVSRARKLDPNNSERMKARWHDPEMRARMIANMGKALQRRPTKPERRLINIVAKYNLPYRYTGDGSFIVAGLNPDFVNINGAKIAIEVFGDHWHKELADSTHRLFVTEESRRKKLAEFGWNMLVLWESELKKLSDESIAQRISEAYNKEEACK